MDTNLVAADGHTLTAWVTGPEDAHIGVVVLPEIFGITAHIRQMAEIFAKHGYRAICPSLFDRAKDAPKGLELAYDQPGVHRGLALRNTVPNEAAQLDIEAAAGALDGQAVRVVTGFCWGGSLSWHMACHSKVFDAASCWYGGAIAKHRHDKPRIPVQMHFGDQDKSISADDVQAIKSAQGDLAIYVYPGAGHAFAREGTSAYHPKASQLAWDRTLAFFGRLS